MIGIAAIGASFLLFVGESVYTLALDKRAAPYHGVRNEVAALAKNIGNGDGLLVANPNAVLVWYYLDRLGFDRRGDQCVGHGKSFACRLFPLAMELAPASQERLAEVYRDNHPSYDIDYFLDDLSPGSRVILYLSKVDAAGRGVKVDRVGGGIVSNLERYGYANYRAIPENNTIIFTRD